METPRNIQDFTKKDLLQCWKVMLNHERSQFSFKQMAFGYQGCGWRKIIINKKRAFVEIIFEKYPGGYVLYTEQIRFKLTEEDQPEKMVEEFNKRCEPPTSNNIKVSITKLNDFL